MKKILYAVLATVSGLVLLFSYKTSLEVVTPTAESASSTGSSTDTSTGSSTDTSTGSSTDTSTGSSSSSSRGTSSTDTSSGTTQAATGLQDGTYTGDAVNTRYGPVQARITVAGGVITAVEVPEYPDNNGRDRQINERAIPQLISETLQSQDSSIDMVSGATYTSEGYVQSLQSALDQAQP